MQKIVAALVVLLFAASLAGCAGDDLPAPTPPVAPASLPASATPTYTTDRSSNVPEFDPANPLPFPQFDTTSTPAVFADKLEAGRPMLVLFYDSNQDVTGDLRVEVDFVINEYRGLIDLVTFDVGKVDDQGVPTPESVASVMYAGELNVTSTPYLIAVDRNGFITWRWRGFVERGYIKREVERATD